MFAWIAGVRQANVLDLNKELSQQITDREQLASELEGLEKQAEHHVEKQLVAN